MLKSMAQSLSAGRPRLPRTMRRFVRRRESFVPAYVETFESGALAEKVELALEELRCCRVCPRDCDVDRLADKKAVCRTGRHALVASAFPHFGEEDCLRGWNGSGTIFFAGCNLRCVFCQNHDISWQPNGEELDARRIAALMLELQERGCHNINFVTPEHVAPQVLEAIYQAVLQGLRLPIVYNTSAFDSLRSLELLDGVVDIYMPDFKFADSAIAKRLVLAEGYPEHARKAVREMHRQVGDLVFDDDGLALRGLLVRHLVMPEELAGTREVMRFLYHEISTDTYVNVMDQYRPDAQVVAKPKQYTDINRPVSSAEVHQAIRTAREEGLYRLDERWRPMFL